MSAKWSLDTLDGRFILMNGEVAFDLDTEDEAIDLEGFLFANSYGKSAEDHYFLFDEWSYGYVDHQPAALADDCAIHGSRRLTGAI